MAPTDSETQGQDSCAISVIIPHLNQVPLLERVLTSLHNQTPPAGGFEIIVIDNGSDVPLEDSLDREKFPDVRIGFEETAGPGPARSTGAGMARADILAFIDADCVAGAGWLEIIEKTFTERPEVQVLGGDVNLLVKDIKRLSPVEAYESVFAYRQRYYVEKVGFCATLNMAVRKNVFEKVGPFGGIEIAEDRDWGRRARAMGIPLTFVPDMLIYHPPRTSLDELCRKWDRLLAHDYRDMAVNPAGRAKWLARALMVYGSGILHLAKILGTNRLPNLYARLSCGIGLLKVRFYRGTRMLALFLKSPSNVRPETWNR